MQGECRLDGLKILQPHLVPLLAGGGDALRNEALRGWGDGTGGGRRAGRERRGDGCGGPGHEQRLVEFRNVLGSAELYEDDHQQHNGQAGDREGVPDVETNGHWLAKPSTGSLNLGIGS